MHISNKMNKIRKHLFFEKTVCRNYIKLVHYGSGSVKRSGLLERIYRSLEEVQIQYISLGGVVPNPHLSLVYEGIELCKKEGVDFILAVGGGLLGK